MDKSPNDNITFYGTVGKGLDGLAKDYLIDSVFPLFTKDSNNCCSIVDYVEGKVFFQVPRLNLTNFGELARNGIKFFERVFIHVDHKPLVQEDGSVANKRQLFDHIFAALFDSYFLTEASTAWNRLQPVFATRKNQSDFEEGAKANATAESSTFRLSVRCTGKWRRKIDVDRLCETLGPKLAGRMGRRVDLRNPDMEISIRVSASTLVIGLPLSKEPFSKRQYIKHMGLRGPVCDAIVRLANIGRGDVILDPMCGTGTILLEASAQVENITAIGVDIDFRQLSLSQENCTHISVEIRTPGGSFQNNDRLMNVSTIPGDCRYLPFRDHAFDCIMCDLPFGRQYSNLEDLKDLYPHALQEMLRVIKRKNGCKMVLLTGPEAYPLLQQSFNRVTSQVADEKRNDWMFKQTDKIDISLGETNGMIVVYTMTHCKDQ